MSMTPPQILEPLTLLEAFKLKPRMTLVSEGSCSSAFHEDSKPLLFFMKENGYFWCCQCKAWIPLENQYCKQSICWNCY